MSDREELEALRRLAELEARAGATPKPRLESNRERNRELMKGGWGTGFGPAVHELGGKVTDLTGSPVAGAATNFLANAVPAFLTSGRSADAPVSRVTEGAAKWLMQSAVKPGQAHRRSGDADKAMKTLLEENIYPTKSGLEKAEKIIGNLNDTVEQAVSASPAAVNVSAVTSRLNEPMKKLGMQVNPQADVNAVEDVWTKFLSNPHIAGRTDIPVQLAHDLKKGTYASLGSKAYGEVGTASTEAQKSLARGLREEVATAVPSIVEPLKREASLMNAREVAMNRALLEANKNPFGLAALRMDDPASVGMTLADRWAALKAFLAMQTYGAGNPQVLYPLGTTAGLLQGQAQDPRGMLYR
jgi:hypothetical protein